MPSPWMAGVTSNSTVCPAATMPSFASTGLSMAGCVFQETVPSFQVQSLTTWMRPPRALRAFLTLATWSWRRTEVTRRVPTPLMPTRMKVRCTPPFFFFGNPASTHSSWLVPKLVVGRSSWTKVSARTVATGAGEASVVVVVLVSDTVVVVVGGGSVVVVVDVVVVVGAGPQGQTAVTATWGVPTVASREL